MLKRSSSMKRYDMDFIGCFIHFSYKFMIFGVISDTTRFRRHSPTFTFIWFLFNNTFCGSTKFGIIEYSEIPLLQALDVFRHAFPKEDADRAKVNAMKSICLSNQAACKIQEQDWKLAKVCCESALDLDEKAVKVRNTGANNIMLLTLN